MTGNFCQKSAGSALAVGTGAALISVAAGIVLVAGTVTLACLEGLGVAGIGLARLVWLA